VKPTVVLRLLVAAAVLSLLVAAPAGAKRLTKLVVVCARGASSERDNNGDLSRVSAGEAVGPSDPYLLIYPLFDGGVPGRPGRYFPKTRVACFSWNRSVLGECGGVKSSAASRLARAAKLPRLREEPTILDHLILGGVERELQSNGAVAIELAFNRRASWRASARPTDCKRVTAVWAGPSAFERPRAFCVAARGLWASRRLYPLRGLDWLLPETLAPIAPPAATMETSAGIVTLAQGSYCWSDIGRGICVDMIVPSLRNDIPTAAVRAGDTIRFRLGFDPSEVTVTLLSPDPQQTAALAPRRVTEWEIPLTWNPASGKVFVSIFTRGAPGETSYLARLIARP